MKIEVLESRRLFASASISGTVFTDTDASKNKDAREPGLSGWTVFLDRNANGQFDSGEPTSITDRKGRYGFSKLSSGTYLVGVIDQNSQYQTSPSVTGAIRGQFHIAIKFRGGMTADERRDFNEAAQRWESIINAEPTTSDARATQQTLTIDAAIHPIDGAGNILGEASPTAFRTDDSLPIKGSMEFDRADLQYLEGGGSLQDVILHEMGHTLGVGTVWDLKGLISSTHNHKPRFTGANAEAAYKALFGAADTTGYVPVQGEGGDGTANAHWSESIFKEELMTGYAEESGPMPISTITVAQFADLGYTVNMNAADDWNPVRHRTVKTTAIDLGAKAAEQRITVAAAQKQVTVDFGYRATETAPTLRAGAVSATGRVGGRVTLRANKVVDAEGDSISGVTFYKESNGSPGLQTGTGGDTYIALISSATDGTYSVSAPSDKSAGTNTYYAKVSDGIGYSRTKAFAITLRGAIATSAHTASHAASIALHASDLDQSFGLASSSEVLV